MKASDPDYFMTPVIKMTGIINIRFAFLFLLIFQSGELFCQVDPATFTRKILAEYAQTKNDSLKIEKLSNLAFFSSDYLGNNTLADSLSEAAIRIAEISHRPELLIMAYSNYLESNDLHDNYQKALGYALRAEQLSNISSNMEVASRIYKNLASVYLSGYEFDKALEYGYKLLSIAGTSNNIEWKVESYLYIGQSLEGKNQKIEAFRNYLNAVGLADRTQNKKLLEECYSRLSNFYNLSNLYDKATHYKLLQRNLIMEEKPVDSVALLWTDYDLQVIDLNSNNNRLQESHMEDILSFAKRNKHHRMVKYEIGLIRTHYIEANKIGMLRDLYYVRFPDEFTKLSTENPALYCRLKAFFCEEENKPDSAMFYFSKAENLMQSDPNIVLKSNFYYRFGQFLVRQGEQDKAIEKFSASYKLAESVFYVDYMLGSVKKLETIYLNKGDFRNAYHFSELNKVLNDSINNMSKKDQMLIMEIDHETRQRDLAYEHERQTTVRRHYLQYTAITIGILSVFIILIMLGSMKVPEWIIRTMGFFSFIFLFEFIILLADQQIHEITHGEPWKVLLIKIFLIAILLPLHHTIEKKVITYLLQHRLLDISRFSPGRKVRELLNKWTR